MGSAPSLQGRSGRGHGGRAGDRVEGSTQQAELRENEELLPKEPRQNGVDTAGRPRGCCKKEEQLPVERLREEGLLRA